MTNTLLMTLLQAGGGATGQMIMIGMVIIVFYFFMIRPQVKKTKEQKKFRESIKKGDKIVTIGGIHGKITDVNDTTFIIEVEGGNKLRIERSAVSMDTTNLIGSEQK